MDAKSIEVIAVSVVKESIVLSDYLDPIIQDNDKEPSWDGSVYIYRNKIKRKDSLAGRVPVQVKGKISSDHTQKEIMHRVHVDDLKNYLNDGGAVYFVVYINESGLIRTIYYTPLTPIKLRIYIKQAKENKTVNIPLQKFPEDGEAKANIFLNCYNDCQKQASFANAILYTEEELTKQGVLENITFSVSSYGKKSEDAILSSEIYFYAKTKGGSILQPLEIIPTDLHILVDVPARITVSGKDFYNHFTRIKSIDETTLRFGESFSITIPKNTQKWKVNYSPADKLRQRAKDLEFLISVIENCGFEINGNELSFASDGLNLPDFDIAQQKIQLKDLQNAEKLLHTLHCGEDLLFSKMKPTEYRNLFTLVQVFVENKPIQELWPNLSPVLKVPIGNLAFAVWAFHSGDNPNTYQIFDFFSHEHPVYLEDGGGLPISQFSILNTDDFLSLNNIQFSALLPSFQKITLADYVANRANNMLLDLLSAYDRSGDTRIDILDAANSFADWLSEIPQEFLCKNVSLLNKLQTIKRSRSLTEDEENQLYELITHVSDDDVLTGAYLLLGIQQLANRHFKRMNAEQQNSFKLFPIYRFWNSSQA